MPSTRLDGQTSALHRIHQLVQFNYSVALSTYAHVNVDRSNASATIAYHHGNIKRVAGEAH
eukprot:scaffold347004_cov17-Prasinocladus_malaysianus.AAC.1